ncbi:MAG: endolytic transglycosylase MltG [Acidimicrobiia bacterium]
MLLPFVIAIAWFAYQLRPGSDGPRVTITIKEGMGTSEIADLLARKDVIGSGLAFKLWTTMSGGGPYQPGCHDLHEGLGVRGATSLLGAPGGELIKGKCVLPTEEPDLELFLPPGRRLDQIAAIVGELTGRDPAEFLAVVNSGTIRSKYQPAEVTSLEGMLFPDTYLIGANWTDEQIVQRLVDRFDEIGDKIGLANVQGLTPYQAIVTASLIQTEAKVVDDAPLISAVIRNRLAQGMQLQVDSTLCYAKGGCPPLPTDADKTIDSPYNTYLIPGLPPTPIASVTEASLRAALTPANVPYLFYVIADEEGRHAFATTLEEHNRNVEAARAKGLL